ncbi:hypothetical protein NP233_g3494 [Leucocoprinus birnbaumii]|uniref:S-adenosyl-L-methionine-dependent methyltransferase n=1 Tax=Leucocoprinus birnbaumii TaxID=56174 RepID=A0AAD5VWX3_9AGAR|nr:hypothetical protein NP233_g3494 [Leucocoprinus birnbaumii]
MTQPSADIASLISLIASAASSLESYYTANAEKPYVPSLDDTEPHPLDSTIYPLDMKQAAQVLEGACAQLCATLVRPNHTVLNKHLNIYQSAFLGVALRAEIADILLDEPTGMHVSEISKRCNIEQNKLARVLRALCSNHVFREVSKDTFANNRLSMLFLKSDPLASYCYHVSDEPTNKSALELANTLLDPEWGYSNAPDRSAFNRALGTPLTLWHYFEGKDNPKAAQQGARFGRGMIGKSLANDSEAIITGYPWEKLPVGAIVNDVGGGWGHIAMKLCERYGHLNLKLQDLPERTELAEREIWPKECPQAISDSRIEFKPVDLFLESPISDCDIYYVKNVIHLMQDDIAIKVLSNIRKVMSPTSRVLLQEYIIQAPFRSPDDDLTLDQAQPPLLPNYGVGRVRQYYTDAAMMVLCNGGERSLEDYVQLAKVAGLQFVKVWDLGELCAVEFAPLSKE